MALVLARFVVVEAGTVGIVRMAEAAGVAVVVVIAVGMVRKVS